MRRAAAAATLRMAWNCLSMNEHFLRGGGLGVVSKTTNTDAVTAPAAHPNQNSQQINKHQPVATEKPHLSSPINPQNVKRVMPRMKENQLQLIPPPSTSRPHLTSALASDINPVSRKHAGFGPRNANARSQPPHRTHACSSGHLKATFFTSALPANEASVSPLLLMWRITYTG